MDTFVMNQQAGLNDKMSLNIFEQELMPHADALVTFAMRYTSDMTSAEDLVQDTYLKAWKSIGSYQTGTNAKAWLCTICRNLFINDYRSKKSHGRQIDFDEIVNFHNDDEPVNDTYTFLQEESHTQLLGDEVAQAINDLPEIYRVVVLLDLQGFTYVEIAAIVAIKLNTVRSRLSRGRAFLANTLSEYAKKKGYRNDDNGQCDLGDPILT
jgi:RNA polymerase sigma factor (sigma-70 family)